MDGGGVKGLVTLRTLKCLEEVIGQPIFDCVDWVIGTSAGGISTCGFACGKLSAPEKELNIFVKQIAETTAIEYGNIMS